MDQAIGPRSLSDTLDEIRDSNWTQLGVKYVTIEPHIRCKFPIHFILSLSWDEGGHEATNIQTLAIRLSLLVFFATMGQEIPKVFQLKAALEAHQQKLVDWSWYRVWEDTHNGTADRLQETQVSSFLLKYGIKSLAINQDTPKDVDYWRANIHDGRQGHSQQGTAQHLIVTAEQMFKSTDGHITRFTLALCNPAF
ncbi:hypothetical protein BDP27DRAFT_1426383 [Rhodocollybia butyracea]|uniref:Uncharacterized protein n=1 Tax=Rhodocollybia butyracea TaxID=206335 RepID=A0A9P5PIB3_9AGAR|nr:hypothetical protein BDP27DRAFT_1426383 [Rhodocollybia butyracea]